MGLPCLLAAAESGSGIACFGRRFASRKPQVHKENMQNQHEKKAGEQPAVSAQSSTLSEIEREQLEKAEILIGQNLVAFTEVGSELQKIHDQQLYREKHKTWAEYCTQRWGFSKSYADRLIKAAKLALGKLTSIGVEFKCEGELRKLVPLTDDQFARVLEKAREKSKKKSIPLTVALLAKQVPRKRSKKNHDDEKLHLPTDVFKKLETLASQVDAVISGKETENSLDLLQQVQAFFKELTK